MNKKSRISIFSVYLCTSLLLTIAVFLPVNAESNADMFDSTLNLSNTQIQSIVEQKLSVLEKPDYSIDKISSYSTEKAKTAFHLVSLKPIGFMVVCSDYCLPPIMAYSFTSSIDEETIEHQQFIDFVKTDISYRLIDNQNLMKNGVYSSKWDSYLGEKITIQTNSLTDQWPPEGYSDTEGWIETQWHQNSPFNDLCPLDLTGDVRGVAGCPAVTMAQILNYLKTINGVSFDDSDDYTHNYGQRYIIDDDYQAYGFPSFPELNDYLATIQTHFNSDAPLTDTDKAALIFACGTAAKQVYSPQGSGTFGVSQAYDAYEKFNFEQIELLTEDDADLFERIIDNIKTGLPVHLAVVNEGWTMGHNLNIDGYNSDDYYHLNFGWGGSYDGWYDLPDELPYELTVIEGVIVDISLPSGNSDLSTTGSIQLTEITPGSEVTGNFVVKNIGKNDSLLNWEIDSFPEWGSWEFSEDRGTGLSPESDGTTIDVTLTVPSEKSKTFSGGIKLINSNNPSDFDVVPISITTPNNKNIFNKNSLFDLIHLEWFHFIHIIWDFITSAT